MSKFTVDTHLFRELGELLVGRDSTALLELIKNAYDADATELTVSGDQLSSISSGSIRIIDNGNGMTREEFENGFLRIASRIKEEGERRSPRLHRRYTGAKGIGRLAAHKLARLLTVESVSYRKTDSKGVKAVIDWDKIETFSTLDEIGDSNAVLVSDS
ncbi:MAG TPA: ATP-binding protein, partial [Terriglobales bacterium]|nr:ATP-binding protein [Terriglobales bacterium]